MTSSPYTWLLLGGIVVSLFTWSRLAKRDERLVVIYAIALVSGLVGAKLVYLIAEGWLDWPQPDRWLRLATGKSILGALLGGYLGVELAKKWVGYQAPTGDLFAIVAPIGIGIGRIGCLLHGCCLGRECAPAWYAMRDRLGVPRWPAAPLELTFNIVALVTFLVLRRLGMQRGQHFHLYLIAYGVFRFAHEFARATPLLGGVISGYQLAALGCVALGAAGYWRRRKTVAAEPTPYSETTV
jgi:phosphatidylglycerol:prolipoprotein diacylglycerol transferase